MMDVGAAFDAIAVGFGIMIATDAQVTAGATAFPSPSTVLDNSWLWHGFAFLRSESGVQADADQVGGQFVRLSIDSKAMRKVKSNDNVVLVSDGIVLGGSPTYDFIAAARILFQE